MNVLLFTEIVFYETSVAFFLKIRDVEEQITEKSFNC